MQTLGSSQKIIFGFSLLAAIACQRKQDVFEAAIARHQGTLVDQVNTPGEGLPYFTPQTLNPIWTPAEKSAVVSIPNFKLLDQDGKFQDSSLFENKITVIGFFFASCSGFCPFLIEGMKSVEREVASLAGDVQFVAFTVNPDEDTPGRLKTYAQQKDLDTSKNWTLLTGDLKTITSLAKDTFASQMFKRPTATPSFVHSEHLYVIDQHKKLRGILNGTRVDVKRDAKLIVSQLVN